MTIKVYPSVLLLKQLFVRSDTRLITRFGFCPVLVTAITGIGWHRLGVFLEVLQAQGRFDNLEVVRVDITRLSGRCSFHHMAGRTTAGPCGFGRVGVPGVFPDRVGIGESLSVAGQTEIVVAVLLDRLEGIRAAVRVMARNTGDLCGVMLAPEEIVPLLVMFLRMGLHAAPLTGPELIVGVEGFAYDVRYVVFVIPGITETPIGLADSA